MISNIYEILIVLFKFIKKKKEINTINFNFYLIVS